MKPLCIDLYCGLGGWAEGFLAAGYEVIGFDIARRPYPGQHVLQDVLTLDGAQFRDAAVIVASPPCQKYSWLAMPWSRSKSETERSRAAKALRRTWKTEGPDNRLFDACFRIQREASEAAGHYIPLIVENVRGAQEWVGRAPWNFGSYYLWGDVPALMPIGRPAKAPGQNWSRFGQTGEISPDWKFQGIKVPATDSGRRTGTKHGGPSARKAASAQMAKIPFPLAEHIASVYYPREVRR